MTEGPYTGFKGEEPEYEGLATWGPVIGNTDPGAAVMLNAFNDQMGMDLNESGWVVGWAMECYEKGVFTRKDLDGLDLTWGNAEAAKEIIRRIANRQGIGDLLAEGVKRASEKIGGDAVNWAVYAHTGAAPRGHDHRGRWCEMLDTCTSNTSTIEATRGGVFPERMGYPPVFDKFSPWEVAVINAKENGWLPFVDCLGICAFTCPNRELTVQATNAVTGWGLDLTERGPHRPEDRQPSAGLQFPARAESGPGEAFGPLQRDAERRAHQGQADPALLPFHGAHLPRTHGLGPGDRKASPADAESGGPGRSHREVLNFTPTLNPPPSQGEGISLRFRTRTGCSLRKRPE